MAESFTDSEHGNGFEDSLAVKVGLWAGADDIPAEGWPETFKPEVVNRILGYLPVDECIDPAEQA